MSRSYREPVWTDNYGSSYKKWAKRQASRKIRKSQDVPNGKAHKKFYDSWNICDYKNRYDPWPSIYFNWITGEQEIIEPIPEWKARRK